MNYWVPSPQSAAWAAELEVLWFNAHLHLELLPKNVHVPTLVLKRKNFIAMNHIFFQRVADYSCRRWRSSNGPELYIIDASLCSLMSQRADSGACTVYTWACLGENNRIWDFSDKKTQIKSICFLQTYSGIVFLFVFLRVQQWHWANLLPFHTGKCCGRLCTWSGVKEEENWGWQILSTVTYYTLRVGVTNNHHSHLVKWCSPCTSSISCVSFWDRSINSTSS